MFKRFKRVIKSWCGIALDNLEEPISTMEAIIEESKGAIYKLYVSLEQVKESILKLDKVKSDTISPEMLAKEKENLKKYEEKLTKDISKYKTKILEYSRKLEYMKAKNEALSAILKIKENISNVNSSNAISTWNRMEKKISNKEIKIKAYEDMDDFEV